VTEAPDRELEDEARALLRPVREPPPVGAEVKARARRRLALALPMGGGGGGGGGGGTPLPAAKGLGRALAARVPAWSLLASFLAGGAVVMLASPRPTASVVIVPAALTEAAPPSASAPLPIPVAPAVIVVPAVVPSVVRPPTVPAPASTAPAASARAGSDGLEAERSLLDVARTALGRGDGGNALRATEEHGRRFPRGILAEEREAMSIQALRLLHRDDDAQARLERFRGRFPTSLIRPALEATDGGTP